ncbi:MAG TPA: hypothetical protein VG269_02815, partial [Tepidisphaeraceae bacterium]|nr:hypothetical protein [Tepidisphaeraceae bacterium]
MFEGDKKSTTVTRRPESGSLHDRPVCWACEAKNWKPAARPPTLPDQSTMSRRARRADFMAFLQRVGERLNGKTKPRPVKVVDG